MVSKLTGMATKWGGTGKQITITPITNNNSMHSP